MNVYAKIKSIEKTSNLEIIAGMTLQGMIGSERYSLLTEGELIQRACDMAQMLIIRVSEIEKHNRLDA